MTLSDYVSAYYGARVLNMGLVSVAVAKFQAAAVDAPELADEARSTLAAINDSLADNPVLRDGDELKRRDFALWVRREALKAVVNG